MSATQAEIIADVRDRIDDENGDRYSDSRIRRWINEILRDACRRTECLIATDTVTAIAGTDTYAAPLDTVRIHLIRYTDPDDYKHGLLQYVDNHNLNLLGVDFSGWTPQVYTQLGIPGSLQFKVHPAPDAAGEFEVTYYKFPEMLEVTTTGDANTEVDMPDGWDDLVADGVEYKLLRADRDPRWQEAKALYDEKISVLLEIATRYNDQGGQWGAEYGYDTYYGGGYDSGYW